MNLSSQEKTFAAWQEHKNAARLDTELVTNEFLRKSYPEHHVTRTSPSKCDLLGYAKAGYATASQRIDEGYDATRVYRMPSSRLDKSPGSLEDVVFLGRWDFGWNSNQLIVYEVSYLDRFLQNIKLLYVLAPNAPQSVNEGHHKVTDELLLASGQWTRELHEEIWVFDTSQWAKNKGLWGSVQDATWDDVILNPAMKAKIIQDVQGFFDNQEMYQKLKIPWKRGVILHGVPGNGKTISIKALINSLAGRAQPVQSLYVKSLDACSGPKWSLQEIFKKARRMAPCLLIFEDLDSLVTDKTRSYFLNEVDGLESNDGILMIGSTNHLDRLDPAVTKRPSRFDRKYHFKLPSEDERAAYSRYWKGKFAGSDAVDFPEEICPIIAQLTDGFSFAYLKELFVTSLLILGRGDFDSTAEVEGSDVASSSDGVVVERDVDPSKDDKEDAAKADSGKGQPPKPAKKLPDVDIPESLGDNELLKIVKAQAKLLLEEIDHAVDESKNACAAPGQQPFRTPFRSPLDDKDDQ